MSLRLYTGELFLQINLEWEHTLCKYVKQTPRRWGSPEQSGLAFQGTPWASEP
jgi:hypothetical protein